DGCHHAKEDEYLFLAMRRRSAEAATILDRLQAEHRNGPANLQALRAQLAGGTPSLVRNEAFIAGLRGYAQDLKGHIRSEEKDAFPLAREVLEPEDWVGINAAFGDNTDPLFGEQARAEYRELYHRIATLAPESIGLGGSSAGGLRHLSAAGADSALLQVTRLE